MDLEGAPLLLSHDYIAHEYGVSWLLLPSDLDHLLIFQEYSQTSLIALFGNMAKDLNYSPTINTEEPIERKPYIITGGWAFMKRGVVSAMLTLATLFAMVPMIATAGDSSTPPPPPLMVPVKA